MAKITDWVQDAMLESFHFLEIKREKGKEQINIAQGSEFVKVQNEMSNGFHYYLIKNDLYTNEKFQKIVKIMVKIFFKKNKGEK
tara:strand:- start:466 stop:717 length:252 start_codon:yes stop_codon:yes gene_type:complete